MIVGTVVGNIWATRKETEMTGSKLLVIEPTSSYSANPEQSRFVAVDQIGAGVGDQVIVTRGSAVSNLKSVENLPIDALVIGIVDAIEIERGDGS